MGLVQRRYRRSWGPGCHRSIRQFARSDPRRMTCHFHNMHLVQIRRRVSTSDLGGNILWCRQAGCSPSQSKAVGKQLACRRKRKAHHLGLPCKLDNWVRKQDLLINVRMRSVNEEEGGW